MISWINKNHYFVRSVVAEMAVYLQEVENKTLLEKLEVKPTSMIDISDGLSSEVMHLCKQSNVGCTIYEEKLPIDKGEEFQLVNMDIKNAM